MDLSALVVAQFTDIFRLGLLAGLIYTTQRTRQQTGVLLPLLAGIVFVAVIIPATMPVSGVPQLTATASGIAVNAVIVGLFWLAWQSISKAKRG
jgi:uncharacterized membrane protein